MASMTVSFTQVRPASTQIATQRASKMHSSASTFRNGAPFRATCQRSSVIKAMRHSAVKVMAAGLVVDVTSETWEEEVLKADLPVLVDFWATWCGPCKLVAPSVNHVAKEFEGKLKCVKIEDNKALMEKYKVYGLPGLIIFKNGQEVEGSHREGAITRKGLLEYLEKNLGLVAAAAK